MRFVCTNLQNMVDYTIIRRNPKISGPVLRHGVIMIYLLWLCMMLIPYIYGRGFLNILCKNPKAQGYTDTDFLLTGVLISIALTEAVHLCGVYGGISVNRSMQLLGILFLLAAVLALAVCVGKNIMNGKKCFHADQKNEAWFKNPGVNRQGSRDYTAVYIGFAAAIIFVIEFIMIQVSDNIYLDGDMTLETVNTFIGTDTFYSVNPLTGSAYTQGLPSRIKILCLPSLYSFFVKAFRISSAMVVWRGVPAIVLIYAASAYKKLADTIFLNEDKKRNLFMLLVAVVFLIGDYMYGVDGFLLLESGFRGVAVRGLVLMPYTVSLVLRKKRLPVMLCIIAEACITWTFYGAGACLLTAAGLAVASVAERRRSDA